MGREDTDVDSRKAGYGDSLQHCRDLGGACYGGTASPKRGAVKEDKGTWYDKRLTSPKGNSP